MFGFVYFLKKTEYRQTCIKKIQIDVINLFVNKKQVESEVSHNRSKSSAYCLWKMIHIVPHTMIIVPMIMKTIQMMIVMIVMMMNDDNDDDDTTVNDNDNS